MGMYPLLFVPYIITFFKYLQLLISRPRPYCTGMLNVLVNASKKNSRRL
jgi:hypothetical protein